MSANWTRDDLTNRTKQKYVVNDGYFTYNLRGKADIETAYTYDKDNRPTKITSQVTDKNDTYNAGLVSVDYYYDAYGRNNSAVYKHGEDTSVLTRTIGYVNPSSTTTTNVIHTLRNLADLYDKTYTYTYDAQGNITSIACGNKTITYEYDKLNQLVRENNPTVGENGETWVYTYDLGGNITSKTKYAYTTGTLGTALDTIAYVYESDLENSEENTAWRDLLISYDGQTISSDAIGNMLSDGTWTYTWQNGRQLASMTKAGTEIEYTYDSDGMRTSKTVNDTITTKYMYYGGQLVAMDTEFGPVYFHYDGTGVMAMEVQGTMLYYVKNSQGDIVALVDTNGYPVVKYTYDAWGNVINTTGLYATTYGVYNPFRYRGYVYDDETGLYYLQTRYYNPEMGRFICIDSTETLSVTPTELTDKNLFTYCDNNPISRADHGGEFWVSVLVGAVVSVAAQYASDVFKNIKSGATGASIFKPTSLVTDYIAAGVSGAFSAIPVGKLLGSVVFGAAGNVVGDFIRGDISSAGDFARSALKGAAANAVGYGVGKLAVKLKVNKINNMNRTAKKNYLRTKFYNNSTRYSNSNLRGFMTNSVKQVEERFWIYRAGIYSTLTSTALGRV